MTDLPIARSVAARPLPLWKWALLLIALACVAAGLFLRPSAEDEGVVGRVEQRLPEQVRGLVDREAAPEAPPASAEAPPRRRDPVSTWLVNGGISFLVAFFVGAAAQRFLRSAFRFVLIVGLLLVGLSFAGLLQFDRDEVQRHSGETVERVADASQGFARFVAGLLPSTTLATVGLLVGFRRN